MPRGQNRNSTVSDTSSPMARQIHQGQHLRDGSISAAGYFDGLNQNQARRSMEMLQEEYEKCFPNLEEETDVAETNNPPYSHNRGQGSEMIEVKEARGEARVEGKEQMLFQQLQVSWSKRNWTTAFLRYNMYDGYTRLGITEWNRLLNWIWLSLSGKHMSELQLLLERFRTTQRMMGDVTHSQITGSPRSTFQQNLIRDYHRVVRSLSTQDISSITQRFYLTDLYRSHGAYVDQFRQSGLVLQTARQRVNRMLMRVFNDELKIEVNLQTITNQLKEGRHWNELLFSRETNHFGCGLLLLLPVRDHNDLVRKCGDSIWTFLLQEMSNLSPRTVALATALQPIAEAIQRKGVGNVKTPLIGYELRSATDLQHLPLSSFNNCLASYPDLSISKAMNIIRLHARRANPDRIPYLVERELKNRGKKRTADTAVDESQPRKQLRNAPPRDTDTDDDNANTTMTVPTSYTTHPDHFEDSADNTKQDSSREFNRYANQPTAESSTSQKALPLSPQSSPKGPIPDSVMVRYDQQLLDLSLMPPPAQITPIVTAPSNSASTIPCSPESQGVIHSSQPLPSNSNRDVHKGRAMIVSKSRWGLIGRTNPPPTTVSQLFDISSCDWSPSMVLSTIQELPAVNTEDSTSLATSSGAHSAITELSPSPPPDLSSEDERILNPEKDSDSSLVTTSLCNANVDMDNTASETAELEPARSHSSVETTEIPRILLPLDSVIPNTPILNTENNQHQLYSTVEVPRSLSPMSPLPESVLQSLATTEAISQNSSTSGSRITDNLSPSEQVPSSIVSADTTLELNQEDLDGLLAELTEDDDLVTNL